MTSHRLDWASGDLPDAQSTLSASWQTLIGFWVSGTVNNFAYAVMLSAANDLLNPATTMLPTSLILLASILPGWIAQLVCPWAMDRIPFGVRVWGSVALSISAFLFAALFDSVVLRILGVIFGSIGSSFGEMTFLALSGQYHKNSVSAWSSGTGAAGVAGAGTYYLMTQVLEVSFQNTLFWLFWVPVIEGLMFAFVIESPVAFPRSRSTPKFGVNADDAGYDSLITRSDSAMADPVTMFGSNLSSTTRRHGSDSAKLLEPVFDEDSDVGYSRSAPTSVVDFADPLYGGSFSGMPWAKTDIRRRPPLTMGERGRLLARLLPYMVPLGLVYFFEYLINQTVDSTIHYGNVAHLICQGQAQYTFLQVLYQIGVFVSRSSVNLVRVHSVLGLQALAFFQAVNFFVMALNVVYGFFPSFSYIVVIVFWEGLLGGMIYVNVFTLVSETFTGLDKEFCLGATSQAYGASITAAALTGFWLQGWLEQRAIPCP